MADNIAPSEGSTQTPSTTPSSSAPSNGAAAFSGESNAPSWVKAAGLEKAHEAAKPAEVTPSPTGATPPSAAATPPQVSATPPQASATPPTPPPQLTLDPKALAQAIREGNAPAPTGPSDEELARQLGIVTLTPELYKATFGVDGTPEQVKALNDYGQGIAKQAVTIAKVLFDREIQQLKDSFTPFTEIIKNQERDRIKSEFFKTNSDLSGYEAVVTQQYQLALASGKKFDSIEAAGKFVAEQTRSHLTSLGIKLPVAGTVPNGKQTSAQPEPQARAMTPTSMGGKGGGITPAAKPTSASAAVWG